MSLTAGLGLMTGAGVLAAVAAITAVSALGEALAAAGAEAALAVEEVRGVIPRDAVAAVVPAFGPDATLDVGTVCAWLAFGEWAWVLLCGFVFGGTAGATAAAVVAAGLFAELDGAEVSLPEGALAGSALATPCPVAMAVPRPSATARLVHSGLCEVSDSDRIPAPLTHTNIKKLLC